jgi:serine/threonine-protein kinase
MFKKNDIQALIFKKTRYLQKLKEQQALRGLDTPASILLEIEDLEIELDNLQAELIGLADAAGQEALTRIDSRQLPLPETKPSAALFPRSPLLKNGERFLSRFTIEGFIGRGGFSDTYLAWDQAQDREVVVKRLPLAQQQQDFLKRFVAREVKIAQKLAPLNIPGLVKTYEVIQAEDEVCLVQESLPSRSLHHRIRDKGIIDIEEAMKTIVQVAQTLARLHQYGFVHGDIKPLNIMLRSPGNPVVIDLGAGRFFDEALEPQHVVYSALYSPQEWLTGQPVDGPGLMFSLWA